MKVFQSPICRIRPKLAIKLALRFDGSANPAQPQAIWPTRQRGELRDDEVSAPDLDVDRHRRPDAFGHAGPGADATARRRRPAGPYSGRLRRTRSAVEEDRGTLSHQR